MESILQQFSDGIRQTGWLEYLAVASGIVSVWFSRREHILVYPTGLVNTVIYVYLSLKAHLPGEASVNFYYTVVSLYGWYVWSRRDSERRPVLRVTFSDARQRLFQAGFFALCYGVLFLALTLLKGDFTPGAIPWADALASASAYTGMWLMARKKVESWFWWIVTNLASIPLYFVKGYVVTSVYYLVLLCLAVSGYFEWRSRAEGRAA
jgi:nicotinamide mononucleotide transporter